MYLILLSIAASTVCIVLLALVLHKLNKNSSSSSNSGLKPRRLPKVVPSTEHPDGQCVVDDEEAEWGCSDDSLFSGPYGPCCTNSCANGRCYSKGAKDLCKQYCSKECNEPWGVDYATPPSDCLEKCSANCDKLA